MLLRNPDLRTPPAPDEGEVTSVEHGFVYPSERLHPSYCHACIMPIDQNVPHTKAVLWLQKDGRSRTSERMSKIRFCNRRCWSSWAQRESPPGAGTIARIRFSD
jgi:hypothetical protein